MARGKRWLPLLASAVCLAALVLAPSVAHAASVVEIVDLDGAGEGLNDPAPFTAAGGNSASTLGAARRRAVELAVAVFAESLESSVPIQVGVRFDPLGGNATQATLGLGSNQAVYRDFAGAPLADTWYPSALADKLAGVDLGGEGSLDVRLTFNSDVDGPVALGAKRFYYGFDGHPAAGDVSFVEIALHELAHGLGFTTLLDLSTGAKFLGRDDAYLRHLERHGATPPDFPSMTDAQRKAASTAGSAVHWTGSQGLAAGATLTAGRSPEGHLEMYAPSPVAPAASLTHFGTQMAPDQIQEPFYTGGADLADGLALVRAVLGDVGWGLPPGCTTVEPPPPAPVTVLDETFDDGDYAGWTIVDQGTSSGPSNWSIVGGALKQSSDIYNDPLQRGTFAVWQGGEEWEDNLVTAQLWSSDDDEIGVMFRYQDPSNFYRFDMDRQGSQRRLVKVVGGVLTVLAQDTTKYRVNDTYYLEITAVGDALEVRLDGQVLFTAADASLAAGTVALSSYQDTGAYFDRIQVVSPPPARAAVWFRDDFTDGNFAGWTVVDIGTSAKPSSWSVTSGYFRQNADIYNDPLGLERGTFAYFSQGFGLADYRLVLEIASGDNDSIGVMFRYQDPTNFYRFDWNKQELRQRLVKVAGGVMTVLAQTNVPYDTSDWYYVEIGAIGNQLSVTIDGAPLFSAVDTALATGSFALASHGNTGAYFDNVRLLSPGPEAAEPFFADDFADGSFTDWTVLDIGTAATPSAWSVVSGSLRQAADIGGDALGRGSLLFYPPGISWSDYRMRVTLWSSDDDEIGVLFRYRDAGNFYRFDWDKQAAERRLVKVVGGTLTVLAQDAVPYLANEKAWIEITTDDDRLQVRVNGSLVFDVTDGALDSGTIALSSYENAGSFFDDVSVSEPPAGGAP